MCSVVVKCCANLICGVENDEWRNMVHFRRSLGARGVPSRHRRCFHSHVSRVAHVAAHLLIQLQSFVGRHCRFHYWTSVGPLHTTSPPVPPYSTPPSCCSQVPRGLSRGLADRSSYRCWFLGLRRPCRPREASVDLGGWSCRRSN